MVIDVHGHLTAPDSLYVYKANVLSHRGSHGRGKVEISDDEMIAFLKEPTFGTGMSHFELLKEVGTDIQLLSPRPYQMMMAEKPPKVSQWFIEECNNLVAQQCRLFPNVFRGVCGLPQTPGVSPKNCMPELERCVKEFGFVGCLINPDPSEATNYDTPGMGDEYWYPLYEKLVELDVPGYIHGAGCRSVRHSYSTHFINEETISVVSLANSRVFQDFPKLKIVCSHGGGAVPYHAGRFLAPTLRRGAQSNFLDNLRKLYFDTVLYTALACELLIKTVGADRCVFGTERPGVGTAKDPKTGKWMDDVRVYIDAFTWLSDADKKTIFEDNAKKLFKLNVGAKTAG
ncbi:MAG TPA: amidohydrolase family protein [Candidatus Acidoferrales bacterium]